VQAQQAEEPLPGGVQVPVGDLERGGDAFVLGGQVGQRPGLVPANRRASSEIASGKNPASRTTSATSPGLPAARGASTVNICAARTHAIPIEDG
jgi:hypothetical protein